MSEHDRTIQFLIGEPGQSQRSRTLPALDPTTLKIDDRSPEDLLAFAGQLAERIAFPPAVEGGEPTDWAPFFSTPEGEELEAMLQRLALTREVPPHLALLRSFLEVHQHAQAVLNTIPARHLAFYIRDVLGMEPRGPRPDRAHLVLALKKGVPSVLLTPDHLFSAGKDASGVELRYAPVRDTVLNRARVASLRSVFVDPRRGGVVRMAPIADSLDGLGEPVAEAQPSWPGFGHPELPSAKLGFALASPALRLSAGPEGCARRITLRLHLEPTTGDTINTTNLRGAFEVFLSSDKGWLGPLYPASVNVVRERAQTRLELSLTLLPEHGSITPYDPETHGLAFATQAPVAQVVLRENDRVGYLALSSLKARGASIGVGVTGASPETLVSDFGTLNPDAPFQPFGPQPSVGARLTIGCPEVMEKQLTRVSLRLLWQDVPSLLVDHYQGYALQPTSNGWFTASVAFRDGHGWSEKVARLPLFDARNAQKEHSLSFTSKKEPQTSKHPKTLGEKVFALQASDVEKARRHALKLSLKAPVLKAALEASPATNAPRAITMVLERDFLHLEHRRALTAKVMDLNRPTVHLVAAEAGASFNALPNEPYRPTLQQIRIDYDAQAGDRTNLSEATLDAFAQDNVQLFHLGCFGQRRVHAYLSEAIEEQGTVGLTGVPLLPQLGPRPGALLIGLAETAPRETVSLLFQFEDGSADPDIERQPVAWSVLCDNVWRALKPRELILDTTHDLRSSGVVALQLPKAATSNNTFMPTGHHWLRAAVQQPGGMGRLKTVAANAIEVEFADQGNAPSHLEQPLPAGSIGKARRAPPQLKAISQPFDGFGGAAAEGSLPFYTRASERLRHKNRCLTCWDYERLVLERFPQIHKVKCIPHASRTSWNAPGHVLLLVVPVTSGGAPIEPRVDVDTIERVRALIQAHTGMQVTVTVKNPTFQQVQLRFKVRFGQGRDFNHHAVLLDQALIRLLSPWTRDAASNRSGRSGEVESPQFGASLYRSRIMYHVEQLDYVDYITDFTMHLHRDNAQPQEVRHMLNPDAPDVILVSHPAHTIEEAL